VAAFRSIMQFRCFSRNGVVSHTIMNILYGALDRSNVGNFESIYYAG
jgi:hypothetical protein